MKAEASEATRRYLDRKAAAKFAFVSTSHIDRARANGDLVFFKVGAKILLRTDDIERWLNRYRIDAGATDPAAATAGRA